MEYSSVQVFLIVPNQILQNIHCVRLFQGMAIYQRVVITYSDNFIFLSFGPDTYNNRIRF